MSRNHFWYVKTFPQERDRETAQRLNLTPELAALLRARGCADAAELEAFLHPTKAALPDPFLFDDMQRLVDRLLLARDRQEKITIYGDYDADGVSATAVMLKGLRALGFEQVDFYIPSRFDEGYGLNPDAMAEIIGRGSRLVLTVDCGISAVQEAELLQEQGIDLLLTDHHQPGEQLPQAYALVNPHRKGETYPFANLAGVGVAYEVMRALCQQLGQEQLLLELLPYVAVGTVGDVVPLVGVNRILTALGIEQINAGRCPGITALAQQAGIGKISGAAQLAYHIVPKLNASGRMAGAGTALSALLAERDTAAQWANKLEKMNQERKTIEAVVQSEAQAQYEALSAEQKKAAAFVFYAPGWHSGVLGIVASRLMERLNVPVFICTAEEDGIKGSGRAPQGYHLYQMLAANAALFLRYGGHAQAAGVTFAADQLETIRAALCRTALAYRETLAAESSLEADLEILAEADLVEQQQSWRVLEPCGCENTEPLVLLRGAQVLQAKTITQGAHLSVLLQFGRRRYQAFAWRSGEYLPEFSGTLDLLAHLQVSLYRGSESFRLEIVDWRPARLENAVLVQRLRRNPVGNLRYASVEAREAAAESGLLQQRLEPLRLSADFPFVPQSSRIELAGEQAPELLLDPLFEPAVQPSQPCFDALQLQQWRQLIFWLLPDRKHLIACYRWLRQGGALLQDEALLAAHPGNLPLFYARICARNALHIFSAAGLVSAADGVYRFDPVGGPKVDLEQVEQFLLVQRCRERLLAQY